VARGSHVTCVNMIFKEQHLHNPDLDISVKQCSYAVDISETAIITILSACVYVCLCVCVGGGEG
jgi:hypothetical protein